MMRLPRFRYFAPRSLAEAAALLAEHGPRARRCVAGGTDLWPNMKRRQQTPTRVIGLRGIAALHGVAGAPASGLTVGAMTSLTAVERDAALAAAWPALGARRAADLHAAAPQHGHARRQPLPRHALQLLRTRATSGASRSTSA